MLDKGPAQQTASTLQVVKGPGAKGPGAKGPGKGWRKGVRGRRAGSLRGRGGQSSSWLTSLSDGNGCNDADGAAVQRFPATEALAHGRPSMHAQKLDHLCAGPSGLQGALPPARYPAASLQDWQMWPAFCH